MRLHGTLSAILLLALTGTRGVAAQAPPSPAATAAADDALQQQLQRIAARHHGKVALYAQNMTTHEEVSLMPNQEVQTASTIKLAILYEALEQVREGRVHFTDRIGLTRTDQVPGSGVLRLLDAPLGLTFKDVLTLMIVMSDNAATNLAIDHLGLERINQRLALLGLPHTYLYKKIFTPVTPGTVLPADQKRFGLGKTTAHEITRLMTRFVTCDLAEAGHPSEDSDLELCGIAQNMLHLQFDRNAIPRYLDALPGATSTSIANKTGALDAARSDVAAISTQAGMIVLAIYTFENADQSWGAEVEGELTMAKLAQAVVAAWSPHGLAAWPTTLRPQAAGNPQIR